MATKKPTAGKPTASQVASANYLGVSGLNVTGGFNQPKTDYLGAKAAGAKPITPGGAPKVTTSPTPPVLPTIPEPPTIPTQTINYLNVPGLNATGIFGATPPATQQNTSSTGRQIAESILRSRGIPEKIINSSLDFINELSLELGDDIETPITILLNSPEYTTKAGKKLASPYYNMYGKFAKYADAETSDPRVLPGLIDDFRALAKAYNLPEEFSSDATIETAFKNKVDYATLDKRYAAAQAKAIIADPFFVESAKQQGFINNTKDLTAFYADAAIGKTQMERNKIQNLLGAETLRAGMKINTADLMKTATSLEAQGYDEATAAAKAAKDMSTVAEQLQPITTYSGIYEGKLAGTTEQIQQELVNEQLLGQASTRRKRLEEMNKAAYQGRSGTTNVSLSKSIQL